MIASLCSTIPWSGGLLTGLFLAGLAGSAAHCGPMCGGFVLGQVADRMACTPAARLCEWRRVSQGALLTYHLGRLTTYGALGALAGALLGQMPWFKWASPALLLFGAALFLAHAAHVLTGPDRAPMGWARAIARMAARTGGGYPLGIVLGFLPCGFLYAALATAAASGSALLGTLGMLSFGIGTVPALAVVGIAGQSAGRRWPRAITTAAPAMMLLNAGLLATLAVGAVNTNL